MSHDHTVARRVPPFYLAVLIRWERLRIVYNILLLMVVFASAVWFPAPPGTYTSSSFLHFFLIRALQANLLFCAGHLVDLVISWTGFGSKTVTATIFALGLLLSVPLTHLSVTMYVMLRGD
jgi:hypothetical protein